MATFRNRHGKWQARDRRLGQQPITKSFQNRQDAERWARQVEADIEFEIEKQYWHKNKINLISILRKPDV